MTIKVILQHPTHATIHTCSEQEHNEIKET